MGGSEKLQGLSSVELNGDVRFPRGKEKILFATASQSLGQTAAVWKRSTEVRQKVFYSPGQPRLRNLPVKPWT